MFGVPSGFGAMSFSDQIMRRWFTFYFLERPKFLVLCISSVFYYLQLPTLTLLSPPNIFLAFIITLLMLFPTSIGRFQAFGPQGTALPCSSPSSALGALDPSSLEAQCHSFLVQGLAPSTRGSYQSGLKKFFEFCTQIGKIRQSRSPCIADEWSSCLFATFSPLRSNTQPSRFICRQFAPCISSKVFRILSWIVCSCNEY